MTALETIKRSDSPFITPAQAARVIGCDPHQIRVAAKEQVETGRQYLGFAFVRVGNRTKIPRLPFIAYVEGIDSTEHQHEKKG